MDEKKTILQTRIFCENIRRILQDKFDEIADRSEMPDADWVHDQFGDSNIQECLLDYFGDLAETIAVDLRETYQPAEPKPLEITQCF